MVSRGASEDSVHLDCMSTVWRRRAPADSVNRESDSRHVHLPERVPITCCVTVVARRLHHFAVFESSTKESKRLL